MEPSVHGCRLFPLLRDPTVERVSVARLTADGGKGDSVVTAKDDADKVLFTATVATLDSALCEHLPKVDHLLFLSRAADGTMAAHIYRPTAKADVAKDAATLCQAEVEAAKLFGEGGSTPKALQQAAGAVTSQKYRDLIFDALFGAPQEKVTAVVAGIPKAVDADLPPGTACPLRTPPKR
jgi:hypothetical protein